jgi:hypothetical protein
VDLNSHQQPRDELYVQKSRLTEFMYSSRNCSIISSDGSALRRKLADGLLR